jgi:hypothetical protein
MRVSSHIVKKGPVIGQYENRPIHDFLVYDDNRVIRFSHVAPVERDGSIILSRLSDGEVVVSPGLVYVRDVRSAKPSRLTERQMTH